MIDLTDEAYHCEKCGGLCKGHEFCGITGPLGARCIRDAGHEGDHSTGALLTVLACDQPIIHGPPLTWPQEGQSMFELAWTASTH